LVSAGGAARSACNSAISVTLAVSVNLPTSGKYDEP
jgi:hypothetical protein